MTRLRFASLVLFTALICGGIAHGAYLWFYSDPLTSISSANWYQNGTLSAGPSLKGPAGPANQLSVAATQTLAPGQPATVSVSGAAPAQQLTFGIPQGVQGPQGTPGDLAVFAELGVFAGGVLDLSGYPQGGVLHVTLAGNVTGWSLPAVIAGRQQVWEVVLQQDATGGRAVVWPTGWWADSGLAPAPSTAAGARCRVAVVQSPLGVEVRQVAQALGQLP